MTDEQMRIEDCRTDVLNALHARRTGAHEATTIRTVFLRTRDYSLTEVETALHELERFHFAERAFASPQSAVEVWQITGQGIVDVQRRVSRHG